MKAGWLRSSDGLLLPVTLLAGVDRAWAGASGGRFGFGAQLARHDRPPSRTPAGGGSDFFALAAALGWGDGDTPTPRYPRFSLRDQYPSGFFPTLRNPQWEWHQTWHDEWMETVMSVHLRLRRLGWPR